MKVVKIENLVKRYGDLVAVDHFNLEIEEGEILAFWGQTAVENLQRSTVFCRCFPMIKVILKSSDRK